MNLVEKPKRYTIGVTNICNLNCPLCVTGLGQQDKKLQFMDYDLFEDIIEKIKDHATVVELYNWGESFLHKDIIKMLALCDTYDLNTVISSNLSLKHIDHILEATVQYRLKKLIVSFDGIDQQDYERYRVNGEFALVLQNIQKINEFKKRYNSSFPIIELQYLENKFTTNQKEVIAKKYKEFGADSFAIHEMLSVFKDKDKAQLLKWFTEEDINSGKFLDIPSSMLNRRCYFLYDQMIIEQDGSIPSCCFTTDKKDDFSIWEKDKTIIEMYNSPKFEAARRIFEQDGDKSYTACDGCSVVLSFKKAKTNV